MQNPVFLCFRLEFGNVTTILNTTSAVSHIELDKLIHGNLLLSIERKLHTFNERTEVLSDATEPTSQFLYIHIGRPATYAHIISFTQVNASHIIVINGGDQSSDHCIRMVNRLVTSIAEIAGNCTESGFRDGFGAASRFSSPKNVILDIRNENVVIISDSDNAAIRSFNLVTLEVVTLLKQGLNKPSSLSYDLKGNLLVSNHHYILRYSMQKIRVQGDGDAYAMYNMYLGSHKKGKPSEGVVELNSSIFYYPQDMIAYSQDLIIVADKWNNILQLVEVNASTISLICMSHAQEFKAIDGAIDNCGMFEPLSLMQYADKLYIGERKALRRMRGRESNK